MKELIEKIKELQDVFKFHCCQVTCEQIIGMIDEQESKPFNPLECGFVVEFNKEGQKEYFLRYGNGHYKLQIQEKIVRLSTYVKHRPELAYLGYPSPYKDYITIRIPNHRFGVELLRNLGVIE